MGLTATRPANARLRLLGALGAGAVSFGVALVGIDDRALLIEHGTQLAAAVDLAPTLAPSLPAALWGRLLCCVPLGSLGMRIALGSALCLGLMSAAVFLASETMVRVQGIASGRVGFLLALGAAWSTLALPAVASVGIGAGPHALSLALGALVVERLTAIEACWPSRDVRPLAVAALLLALLLAHDPIAALVILPAGVPSVARIRRARAGASLELAMLGFVLALGCLSLGVALGAGPGTWLRAAAAADAPALWAQLWKTAPVLVVVALLGAVALLRAPGAHRLGQVWGSALALPLLMDWLGPAAGAAPAGGRYLLACCAVSVLALSMLASLAAERRASSLVTLFALCVAVLGASSVVYARRTGVRVRAQGAAVEWVAGALYAGLPARALLVVIGEDRARLLTALEREGRERPDLQLLALDTLSDLAQTERLGRRHPELKPLLRSYLFEGELGEATLQTVSGQRPLRLEVQGRVAPALYPSLLPDGLWFEVADAAGNEPELRAAERRQQSARATLAARLDELPIGQALSALLGREHYFAALYFAARARPEVARVELVRARKYAPAAVVLGALEKALDAHPKTVLDVQPFVDRW